MYSSRVPPPDEWEELERTYIKAFLCTHDGLPFRLFCGKPAVFPTENGPRCAEHLEAVDSLDLN